MFESKYFTVIKFDGKTKNVDAKCLSCNEIVKGNATSTGNLRGHIQRNHTSLFEEIYGSDSPHVKLKQSILEFCAPKVDMVYS